MWEPFCARPGEGEAGGGGGGGGGRGGNPETANVLKIYAIIGIKPPAAGGRGGGGGGGGRGARGAVVAATGEYLVSMTVGGQTYQAGAARRAGWRGRRFGESVWRDAGKAAINATEKTTATLSCESVAVCHMRLLTASSKFPRTYSRSCRTPLSRGMSASWGQRSPKSSRGPSRREWERSAGRCHEHRVHRERIGSRKTRRIHHRGGADSSGIE